MKKQDDDSHVHVSQDTMSLPPPLEHTDHKDTAEMPPRDKDPCDGIPFLATVENHIPWSHGSSESRSV